MRKKVLSFMMVVVILLTMFAACSSKKSDMSTSAKFTDNAGQETNRDIAAEAKDSAASGEAENPQEADMKSDEGGEPSITGVGGNTESISNAILSERKIIRNANVSLEVENFDVAYGKINSMISAFGFVQETNIRADKVKIDSKTKLIKSGSIVVRVDKGKFDKVMNGLYELGDVVNENRYIDDVTYNYFDTESRLRLLKFEEGRLEEYLHKLTEPDMIFKTESRLTDIRHEIEGLTGTLKKWDDLIKLSTITINMFERNTAAGALPAEMGYGQRLLNNFLDSISGVVKFCGELLILVVQALPALALIVVFVFLGIRIFRKVKDKKENKPGGNDKNIQF